MWRSSSKPGTKTTTQPETPPEFCEGLDVADGEFEDWIRNQREAWRERIADRANPPSDRGLAPDIVPLRTPKLIVARPECEEQEVRALIDLIGSEIASRVAEFGGVEVSFDTAGKLEDGGPEAWRLALKGCRLGQTAVV